MKINYSISFRIDGVWMDDYNFKRGVYAEQPLDETLDTGIVVNVPSTLQKINPFTLCRVTAKEVLQDGTEGETLYTKYYWTGDSDAEAVTLFGVGNRIGNLAGQKYKQSIKLIELTKILEREPCDSLSFTHRLQKIYLDGSTCINYTARAVKETYWNADFVSSEDIDPFDTDIFRWDTQKPSTFYISPIITGGSLQLFYIYAERKNSVGAFLAPSTFIINNTGGGALSIVAKTGENTYNTGVDYTGFPAYRNNNGTYTPIALNISTAGTKNIKYTYVWEPSNSAGNRYYYKLYIDYSIVVENEATIDTKPIPSIPDVINRLLDVGTPRPIYKGPKYKLDPVIAAKFANTPAPEFFFPRMTLFEGLLEVGRKIHAIPRLTFNEDTGEPDTITYDLLGLDDEYSFPDGAEIVGHKRRQAADEYCGALDSYVDNHINTVDPNAGTVTEPFEGGYKTLRCESGVQITNQSAVFECSRPIYRIVKVEMAYTQAGQSTPIGDITKYVFEQAEYAGLFASDQAGYPNSISHALVWKQGDRFIRGFNTTSSSILNIIQQFQKPSIQNIVKTDEGKPFPDGTIYGNLAFRVTYIPMDNIRLRQYKPYDTHPDENLLYNQQNANTVEASAYGENLKGKIARMGNEIEVYTVRFTDKTQPLPLLGNLLVDENDDVKGYVFKITTRDERNYRVADIYVTPDFNRLSEYFALESNFRLLEVSERQSIDRQVIVPRIINVSLRDYDDRQEPNLMQYKGIVRFMDTFTQKAQRDARPTVAVCRTIAEKRSNSYPQIGKNCYALPVNSTACGNSLAFSFAFKDSFSAGDRSAAGGYSNGQWVSWKQRKNSPYGDIYGAFWGLEFSIADGIYQFVNHNYDRVKRGIDWSDQSTAGGFCDSLPTVDNSYHKPTMGSAYIGTQIVDNLSEPEEESGIRVIDKNSSEHISVVVQFHGRALDKRIVFGTAMWNNNLLIRDDPVKKLDEYGNPTSDPRAKPRVFGLTNKRLNMLRDKIDVHMNNNSVITGTGIIDFGEVQEVSVLDGDPEYGRIHIPDLRQSVNNRKTTLKSWCIADPTNGEIYIGVNETVVIDPVAAFPQATSDIYFIFDKEA